MPWRHNSPKFDLMQMDLTSGSAFYMSSRGLCQHGNRAREAAERETEILRAFGSLRELVDRAADSVRPVENMRVDHSRADVVVAE